MKLSFIINRKDIILTLCYIYFLLLISVVSSCSDDYSLSYDDNDTGSYTCSINWPEDVPTLETKSNISRAIDCDAADVMTVAFRFYDSRGGYLTDDEFDCSLHVGTVHGIESGTKRQLVVSGKDASGKVLYQGKERGIEIKTGKTTQGGEINMTRVRTMLNIPDTGQTQSYTDTFGEDSDYTINPPDYTDNGDGTITDNVTGLMWQKEDDDITRTWDDAIIYCNDLTLGGYSDWCLPSRKELISIVNFSMDQTLINITYFPGTNGDYWSSTTSASDSSRAWIVGSWEVSLWGWGKYDKSTFNYVRCVR